MPTCPGCGRPAPHHSFPEGRTGDWWCRACLDLKIADARAGSCHCGQAPAPHVHPLAKEATR